jgi:hypothetical protein
MTRERGDAHTERTHSTVSLDTCAVCTALPKHKVHNVRFVRLCARPICIAPGGGRAGPGVSARTLSGPDTNTSFLSPHDPRPRLANFCAGRRNLDPSSSRRQT